MEGHRERITEKELILPALYIINRDRKVTTSELIRELTYLFDPQGEDAEILANRSDTKFSQKVRNLVSHRENNRMAHYTFFNEGEYTITTEGQNFLNTKIDELDYLFSQKFKYLDVITFMKHVNSDNKQILLYSEQPISEGTADVKLTKIRERSKILRNAAVAYYTKCGRICCSVCGFDFERVYGELGKGFIEIHHERPICQYENGGNESFVSEAVKFVKPLCANCHRMIHRNSKRPLSISELEYIMIRNKN